MDFGDGGTGWSWKPCAQHHFPLAQVGRTGQKHFLAKPMKVLLELKKMHIKIEKIYEPLLKHCLGGWFGAA